MCLCTYLYVLYSVLSQQGLWGRFAPVCFARTQARTGWPVRARARARARALNRRPDPDWGRARLCGVRRGTLGPTLRAPDNNYDYCPNNQDLFQWAQSGSAQTNLFHTTSANYQLSSGLRWVETSLPDHLGQAGKPGLLLSDLIALGFPTYRSLCWVPGPSICQAVLAVLGGHPGCAIHGRCVGLDFCYGLRHGAGQSQPACSSALIIHLVCVGGPVPQRFY